MHGGAVQAMGVSLLSMLIVLEAAWAGSVPCNVASIDVAAYDTEHQRYRLHHLYHTLLCIHDGERWGRHLKRLCVKPEFISRNASSAQF